jgi:electron transport complex protein RnfB
MTGLLVITLLSLFTGAVLGYASTWFAKDNNPLVDQINQLLPQTQCAQCGYPGCRPYAQALATGEAEIDQCPPGGEDGVAALAALLDRPVIPLNPEYGVAKEAAIAVIQEADCIGCTLCIDACPVDAIVGAPKLMHTVIAAHCTGCELCLPPCPVDCIDLVAR